MKQIGFIFILFFLYFPLQSQIIETNCRKLDSIMIALDNDWDKGLIGLPQKELSFLNQLEKQFEKYDCPKPKAGIKIGKGHLYGFLTEYNKALISFQEALKIIESSNDSILQTNATQGIGNIYWKLGDYEKAIISYERAIDLNEGSFNDSFILGSTYCSLGTIYGEKGEFDKGLKYLFKGKTILEKADSNTNLHHGRTDVDYNIAVIYAMSGRPKQALPYFKEKLLQTKALKDTFDFAGEYGNIAYTFQGMGNFEQALIYYDSSLYYSNLLSQDDVTYLTLLDISDGYALNGDYKKALEYQKKYQEKYQKIVSEKTKKKIADLEVKYETEKKERALAESRKEIATLEQQALIRTQRMWLILGGLMTSLIIAFLMYFKWKSDLRAKAIKEQLILSELKNQELEAQQLQTQLDYKKSDLTNLALEITRKNDFSKLLLQHFEKLNKQPAGIVKQKLKEVERLVIQNLAINEDLALLQENIDQTNQNYYQSLINKFPNLNKNELNLCGLIRLNFSNKEIALVKNITPSSAKMSRYRIRKKLNLSSEEDIVTFLQEIS